MDYEKIKEKFLNQKFIVIFILIFFMLFIFVSFIKFLGQWPILLLISLLITYYIINKKLDIMDNFY